jgi:hypothetical protein
MYLKKGCYKQFSLIAAWKQVQPFGPLLIVLIAYFLGSHHNLHMDSYGNLYELNEIHVN